MVSDNQYKRILSIQDISCVGQCSLTVALPILSAMGYETSILPTAVLSTHSAPEFGDFTFRDLTEDIPGILNHWRKLNIKFQGVYTGYLGNMKQIQYVKDVAEEFLLDEGVLIVDPVMGDHGKLYSGFDKAYVREMKKLCAISHVIIPNLTEASHLTGMDYLENYDEKYIREILERLAQLGCKNVVLTGVSFKEDETGVAIWENGIYNSISHQKYDRIFLGTGDIFSSVFTGNVLKGKSLTDSATFAADFVLASIKETLDDDKHWYGVKFEKVIKNLL